MVYNLHLYVSIKQFYIVICNNKIFKSLNDKRHMSGFVRNFFSSAIFWYKFNLLVNPGKKSQEYLNKLSKY